MKDAQNILQKASDKGLLRRVEQHEAMGGPKAGEPAEAADAVHSLNEADNARVQGTMSAADFSNVIANITYDASPYKSPPTGGSRKSKSRKSKSKSRKSKSKSRKSKSRKSKSRN